MPATPTTASPRHRHGAGLSAREHRTDIQGLRAIAVVLVVVYHLVPSSLTGGFVGVDVFFVLSGFLITSHLVARPPRTGTDLVEFWARRIRRLLPAALVVLAVTLVLSRLLAPATQWENTARQGMGAALYVENWLLATEAVDYLAADNAATPVQHYWSLSVEEQFYFGWPILLLAVVLLLRRRPDRLMLGWTVAVGAVLMGSLAWSIRLTETNPAAAYFVTPTRVWELAAGGLLAILAARFATNRAADGVVRAALAWTGLAMMVWSAISFTPATPFPGWQAAVPVVGALLVVGARCGTEWWSPGRYLALAPVQWVGDISYAVYLWHWPLIVLVPFIGDGGFAWPERIATIVVTLLLATLTTRFIEEPFRRPAWRPRVRSTYLLGAAAMAVVVAAGSLQVLEVKRDAEQAKRQLAAALSGADPCFGAGARRPGTKCPEWAGDPVPAPVLAAQDKSAAYSDVSGGKDCWSSAPDFPAVECTFGASKGEQRVALVGNSHAGHWLPALERIGKRAGWRISTHLASRCAMAQVRQDFDTSAQADACEEWVERISADLVRDRPDLIVLSNRISLAADGAALDTSAPFYRRGYERVIRRWVRAGVPVVAIHDTPAPGDGGLHSIPDCLSEHTAASRCDGPRAEWLSADPVAEAVAAVDSRDARLVDVNDLLCDGDTCQAVIGGVVVYFDGSHLTATFAQTLAPFLEPDLRAALG